MKITLVNAYFWPDMAATAQLLTDLAEDLVEAGFEVTALAGRGSYARPGPPPPAREIRGGIRIRRLPCTSFGRGSALRRLADSLSFLAAATLAVLLGPRRDLVVCLSTPPFAGLVGLAARLRGARVICKVEDVHPDVATALGLLRRGSGIERALRLASRWLLRAAHDVVTLDAAMRRRLEAASGRPVRVIPNWADGERIRPDPEAGRDWRRRHGLGKELVVLYSGNFGLAHRFDGLLAAARDLARQGDDTRFLLVGDGPRRAELVREAEGLPNVRFLPYQPRERLAALYAAADLHVVTLRDELAGLLVPCKYAAALAAGRPVLLVGGAGTEMRDEVVRERLGFAVRDDAREIAAAIRRAARETALNEARGRRARERFESRHARELATARWARLIRDGLATSAGRAGTPEAAARGAHRPRRGPLRAPGSGPPAAAPAGDGSR